MSEFCPIDGLPLRNGVCPVHGFNPSASPTPLAEHAHALTSTSAVLADNVTLTDADTWYDGPSLSLVAGTWLLTGAALLGTSGTQARYQARLTDGSTTYAAGEGTPFTTNGVISVHLSRVVTLTATTTVKIQGCSGGAARTMYAATTQTTSVSPATYINAVKLST